MLGIYFQDFHTFCSNAIERLQIKRNNMQSYKHVNWFRSIKIKSLCLMLWQIVPATD